MKKTFTMTIAAFAMASAAFAQADFKPADGARTVAAENVVDSVKMAKEAAKLEKAAAKAKKAEAAAQLKAFKAKQKADLAAFVEAQKKGTPATLEVEPPTLANAGDSLGFLFGISQSNGLEQYAKAQLGVDADQLSKFAEGIMQSAGADPEDKDANAFSQGLQIGNRVTQMTKQFSGDYYSADPDMSISPAIVAKGLVMGLLRQGDITPDSAMSVVQTAMPARQAANNEKLYGANREAGEKFLAENKTKEGVVTLPSGLQYKVITMGEGDKPAATDKVNVDYEGRLIDGTVFDSSYKRGKATSFNLNQVIAGWTEVMQLMPVGSKWEVYIPYDLAYGDRQTGKEIKPYSTLIFTIELHVIEK